VLKRDDFTYVVRAFGKAVTFHLNRIDQQPPQAFKMLEDERFVERTCDESGMRFFLLFNHKRNYFLWVLDEEGPVPDQFTALAADVVAGKRTGFVFWLDPGAKPRKVLASVRELSVRRNDYYDGPFDQLSDNYVASGVVEIRKYMELAMPALKGRIDEYGYYLDGGEVSRVALINYGSYRTLAEALDFVNRAKQEDDPRFFLSRGGRESPAR